jgi:hypothetical protein
MHLLLQNTVHSGHRDEPQPTYLYRIEDSYQREYFSASP